MGKWWPQVCPSLIVWGLWLDGRQPCYPQLCCSQKQMDISWFLFLWLVIIETDPTRGEEQRTNTDYNLYVIPPDGFSAHFTSSNLHQYPRLLKKTLTGFQQEELQTFIRSGTDSKHRIEFVQQPENQICLNKTTTMSAGSLKIQMFAKKFKKVLFSGVLHRYWSLQV